MKERLYKFMQGRNGNDQLNRFILAVSVIFLFLALIAHESGKGTLFTLALILLGLAYFRMLSKNVYKRSDENNKYIRAKLALFSRLKNVKERWVQRKDYKFFTCPKCRATLRVPRGRGKIKIVCRKCGNTFIGKS